MDTISVHNDQDEEIGSEGCMAEVPTAGFYNTVRTCILHNIHEGMYIDT